MSESGKHLDNSIKELQLGKEIKVRKYDIVNKILRPDFKKKLPNRNTLFGIKIILIIQITILKNKLKKRKFVNVKKNLA